MAQDETAQSEDAGSSRQVSRWDELWQRAKYHIRQLVRPVQPSSVPGMGAIVHDETAGVTFRVWAPHAEHVFVTGTFNGWSEWRTPLARERGNGHWSVKVPEATVGEGYKYIIHSHGQTFLRADPYASEVAGPDRHSIIHRRHFFWTPPPVSYNPPARDELVIYELHVGTFNEDPENVVGTFRSLRTCLPYLRQLGINAIELMPVAEFAGDYSWGYNPAYPFAISRTYGGRQAFKGLVEAAHKQGIAVIVDVVYNHLGPQDLDLWRFDGWHENGKGGIYFYNDWRSKTPWADTRLDYGRREVREYVRDNVFMWLETFRVDGLRWDATSYIRNAHGHDGDPGADIAAGWQMMQEINAEVRRRYPERFTIAEDMQENEWLTKSVAEGGAGFNAQWDANFVHTVREAIISTEDDQRDIEAVAAALRSRYDDDPFDRIIFTESHDEVANGKARVPEEIAPGESAGYFAKKRSILGAALVLTAPGIPMLFQGQEFLEDGWFSDQDPLDWRKAGRHRGILLLYQKLIKLRRNLEGTTRGLLGPHVNVFHTNNQEKVLAFHRWDQGGSGDDVIVVVNFGNRPRPSYTLGFPHEGLWHVRFNSDEQIYDPAFGAHTCPDVVAAPVPAVTDSAAGLDYWGNVTLAPYTVLILSQDPGKR